MANVAKGGWRRWLSTLILFLISIGVVASFLPLIETNIWWIRFMDFPRLQLGIALIVLIVLLAVFSLVRRRVGALGWVAGSLAILAVGYHALQLYPYSPLAARQAASLEQCPDGGALTVMIANVKERNEFATEFLDLVAETDPDLLLIMETDEWWDRNLAPLDKSFMEKEQYIPTGEGDFGMHLYSKLRLISPEFRFFFDAYTPTAITGVELRNGSVVRFLGLHPLPPLPWSQPTTRRDASVLTAALEARSSEAPTIVAGDFNTVPWEEVTRRAARIGGLLDPRIGRGLYPTFSATNWLIAWPLDHVFYQEEFGLIDFEMLPSFGSDHFPIMARLCHAPDNTLPQSVPELEADDLQEAERSMEAAQAMEPTRGE